MTKARELGKLVSQGEVLADGVVQAAEVTGLASVATSGSYADLTNKPALASVATSGSYTDLTNKPTLATVAATGSYADLTNKPTIPSVTGLASETFVSTQINSLINGAPGTLDTLKEIADQLALDQSATAAITTALTGKANTSSLSTVATTGSYTDLTNKPTIPTLPTLATVATSGSYVDLTNKPTIPTLPTLATVATTGNYNDLINKPVGGGTGGVTSYTDLTDKPTFATVATTGSYTDLINKPTIPTLPTLATVATSGSYVDLTNKPTIPSGSYTDLTNKPTLFSGSYVDLTNKPTLFSGSYADLTNKPTITGGIQYSRKTANYTAADKEGIIADTTTGSFTITLPPTPDVGAQVVIADGNSWGTNNLTIGRNGSTIEGTAENLILDVTGVSVQFLYDGTTWEVFAQAGILSSNNVDSSVIKQNETTVSTNQTIAAGFNGQSVGPITVNTGVGVTVATGQLWLVY
jgi:hypothetical protein